MQGRMARITRAMCSKELIMGARSRSGWPSARLRARALARLLVRAQGCIAMQVRLFRIKGAMCSKVPIMAERALWDGRVRVRALDLCAHERALWGDGLRRYNDVTPSRAGWFA